MSKLVCSVAEALAKGEGGGHQKVYYQGVTPVAHPMSLTASKPLLALIQPNDGSEEVVLGWKCLNLLSKNKELKYTDC